MKRRQNYTLEILEKFDPDEIRVLYDSVGWQAYTDDVESLIAGLYGSNRVIGARANGSLVGLARVISDGHTIAYLQDILVDPRHQRSGLGRLLVKEALKPFNQVRQTVLLTDDEPRQRAFYESLGFTESRDFVGFQLRAFVRFRP